MFGPVESGVAAVLRPITAIPDWFRSATTCAAELSALEAENAELRSEVATSDYDRNRLEEYDGLTAAAENLGYRAGARPAWSRSARRSRSRRTVTIDAGSDAGIHARPDGRSTTTGWSAGCCG